MLHQPVERAADKYLAAFAAHGPVVADMRLDPEFGVRDSERL
jgi:hypothetical protein